MGKSSKSSKPSGVELFIQEENIANSPKCPHGPTLLFSRRNENRLFYACSAYRDRKYCRFFLWHDEKDKLSKSKLNIYKNENLKLLNGINHRKKFLLLNKIKILSTQKRLYCENCEEFLLDNDDQHNNHKLLRNLNDYQLEHPSEILTALINSKKEAQYLFAKSAISFLVNLLLELKIKNVICIGTPRIHEYIRSEYQNISSILLDIDRRFHSFFGPMEFCWYNMFNNYFFFNEGKEVFDDFLKSTNGENTALITDPPFGGRIEPLAHTFQTINNQYRKLNNKNLSIFWIFPYFMEPQLLNFMDDFNMLDYKVDYENHILFRNGVKGRKYGSPIRIFTNLSTELIKLPEDLYRFCLKCKKWVSIENKHCSICDSCTSKNGTTYVHCNLCKRCVKPSWKHCKKCNRCAQLHHKCEMLKFNGICLNCNIPGHKKNECPKYIQNKSIKRKKIMQKSKINSIKKQKMLKNKS